MLDRNIPKSKIAKEFGVHISSIYREIDRGNTENGYNPKKSEERRQKIINKLGRPPILSCDSDLAQYISDSILKENLSPESIVLRLSIDSLFQKTSISRNTIYHAVDSGLVPNVTREALQKRTAKMFSRGHIIIPDWIREKCGYKDGDLFRVDLTDNNEIVLKKY